MLIPVNGWSWQLDRGNMFGCITLEYIFKSRNYSQIKSLLKLKYQGWEGHWVRSDELRKFGKEHSLAKSQSSCQQSQPGWLTGRQSSCPDHRPWRRRAAGMAHSALLASQPWCLIGWDLTSLCGGLNVQSSSLIVQTGAWDPWREVNCPKFLVEPDASPPIKTCVLSPQWFSVIWYIVYRRNTWMGFH